MLVLVGALILAGCSSTPESVIIHADLVRGHTNPQGPLCAIASYYQQGESIVFRVRLIDPATGVDIPGDVDEIIADEPEAEELAELAEGIEVTAHLSDGQTFPLHYGIHGDADAFWTSLWVIADDYPTGAMDFWVTVDYDGRTGRFEPFDVGYSKLTIVEAVEAAQ